MTNPFDQPMRTCGGCGHWQIQYPAAESIHKTGGDPSIVTCPCTVKFDIDPRGCRTRGSFTCGSWVKKEVSP